MNTLIRLQMCVTIPVVINNVYAADNKSQTNYLGRVGTQDHQLSGADSSAGHKESSTVPVSHMHEVYRTKQNHEPGLYFTVIVQQIILQ